MVSRPSESKAELIVSVEAMLRIRRRRQVEIGAKVGEVAPGRADKSAETGRIPVMTPICRDHNVEAAASSRERTCWRVRRTGRRLTSGGRLAATGQPVRARAPPDDHRAVKTRPSGSEASVRVVAHAGSGSAPAAFGVRTASIVHVIRRSGLRAAWRFSAVAIPRICSPGDVAVGVVRGDDCSHGSWRKLLWW